MYSTNVHAIKRLCRHFDCFYNSTYLLIMLIDNRFKTTVKGLIRLSEEVFEISYIFISLCKYFEGKMDDQASL